ncbi:hypothetical protein JNUCC64_13710 [Streptomyces sp. JNUCC 64]
MTDGLTGLSSGWVFVVVWVCSFTVLTAGSLLRLGHRRWRDRRAIGRFPGAGPAVPVLAAYHLAGPADRERAAARAGTLVLSRRERHTGRGRGGGRKPRPEPHPLLETLQAAVRDAGEGAGGAVPLDRVMASPRFPAFTGLLREEARRRLPRLRTRHAPGRVAAWAAVGSLPAVLVHGIGFHSRQPGASGAWFLIALAAHAPVALWLGLADGRSAASAWPAFDALCERHLAATEATAPRPDRARSERAADPGARPGTTDPARNRPGPDRAPGWWADGGGVGAGGSCGGGSCGGGCGGGT